MVTGTRMTLDDFLAMPGIDERRLELIDGEVYEKMSPRWGHGRMALRIGQLLNAVGFAAVEPRAIIRGSADLGPSSPIPDVAYYRANPPADDEWISRPPDVAVEILSIGQDRREMRTKIDLYRQFGVGSVWVVDLERREVEVYEGTVRRTLSGQDVLESTRVPGLAITIDQLFAGPPARDADS
ncbi:MAG: Uma2 family endonuclease [Thermoflexaceae bacterium]|nr:Uma2 family endonuclease [Thermoflexaceae bacterium]